MGKVKLHGGIVMSHTVVLLCSIRWFSFPPFFSLSGESMALNGFF